jgi:hypothetical protein
MALETPCQTQKKCLNLDNEGLVLTKEYITELKHRGNGDIAALLGTYQDVGSMVFILEGLGRLPNNFQEGFLYDLLSHNHPQVRLNAVKNIGKLNGKFKTEPLVTLPQYYNARDYYIYPSYKAYLEFLCREGWL